MTFRTALLIFVAAINASAESADREISLRAFETVDLNALTAAGTPASIQVYAFRRVFSLELAPNTNLLSSLKPRQRGRVGGDDLFLKGALAGMPGSWARLNRINGSLSGGFFDGEELYLIDSAAGLLPPWHDAVEADATIVYRLRDLDLPIHVDAGGVDFAGNRAGAAAFAGYGEFVDHLREVAKMEDSAMFAMPLTVVSDVQFSNRHGSQTASVVAGRINLVDGIYSNQVGVGIALWHHEILRSNGSLTSSGARTLLDQFQTFMKSGAGSDIPFQGLAHLFTGRDLNGGTVGIAFLGTLCSSFGGYGVNQNLNSDTTSALVVAHELGHNFGAGHDNDTDSCPAGTFRGIMNSSIDGTEEFSQCSLDAMSDEVATAGCLIDNPGTEPIFADGFETP